MSSNQFSLNTTWIFRGLALIYGPVYFVGVALMISENNGAPFWCNAVVVAGGVVATMAIFLVMSLRFFESSNERTTRFRISTVMLLMALVAINLAAVTQIFEFAIVSEASWFTSIPIGCLVFVIFTNFVLIRMTDALVAIALGFLKGVRGQ